MPISMTNASALNSRRVAACALRPNRPKRPSAVRLGRPEMPSPLRSSGSARARISASGTASSSPKPKRSGVVRWPESVAAAGIGSAVMPRASLKAGVTCF